MSDTDVIHMAICFDCGWEGAHRVVAPMARNDADEHECEPRP